MTARRSKTQRKRGPKPCSAGTDRSLAEGRSGQTRAKKEDERARGHGADRTPDRSRTARTPDPDPPACPGGGELYVISRLHQAPIFQTF